MLQAGRSPVRVPDEVDIFNLPNPSSSTMALGSTQPLPKMSTRILPEGENRPARRADNFAAMSRMSEDVGASTSRNPKGLHGLYRDTFTLLWSDEVNVLKIETAKAVAIVKTHFKGFSCSDFFPQTSIGRVFLEQVHKSVNIQGNLGRLSQSKIYIYLYEFFK
jgi:hypothetical protein